MKTISGHYDTVFSIAHNNRTFTPSNVDPSRSCWNYNCVTAGQPVGLAFEDKRNLAKFWADYKALSEVYWEDRRISKKLAYEEYLSHLQKMRRYRPVCRLLYDNGISGFITLLFIPLLLPCGIYINCKTEKAREVYDRIKEEQ